MGSWHDSSPQRYLLVDRSPPSNSAHSWYAGTVGTRHPDSSQSWGCVRRATGSTQALRGTKWPVWRIRLCGRVGGGAVCDRGFRALPFAKQRVVAHNQGSLARLRPGLLSANRLLSGPALDADRYAANRSIAALPHRRGVPRNVHVRFQCAEDSFMKLPHPRAVFRLRWSPIAPQAPMDLADRVAWANVRIPLQLNDNLFDAMDDDEIEDVRRSRRGLRRKTRHRTERRFGADLAAERREDREATRIRRHDERQRRWLARARANRDRATNAHAQEAALHRRATWASLRLRAVMTVGLTWSAVNVGRNLMPVVGPSGAVWWLQWILSFGLETMISVPILEIMAQAAAAARLGRKVKRAKIIIFEAGLLLATVGLNCGPHLAAGNLGRAAEYAVAPIMVVVLMWVHAWIAERYATLIAAATDANSTTDIVADRPAPVLTRGSVSAVTPRSETIATGVEPSVVLGNSVAGESNPADGQNEAMDRYARVAVRMVETRQSQKSVSHLVQILRLADQGGNANAIAARMSRDTNCPWQRSTVDRLIKCADTLGFRTTAAGGDAIGQLARAA